MLTIMFVCLFALLSLVERVQCQTQTSLPAASYQAVSSDSSGTHLTAVVYNGPIYYSNDSGVSWAVSDAPTPTATYEAVATSSTGQYVIINSQSATYVSSDYGQHFTNITNVGGLSNTVAVSSTGQYMVAVSSSLSPNNCLSYSNDYGASFTLNLGPSTTSDFCVGVSIDTSGTYVVVSVYNQGLWTSNGVTNTSSWKLTTATTLEISAIAFGGTSFYAGFVSTPAYVIQSTDYGATWDAKGSVSNSIVSISVDSTGAQVLLGTFYNLFFSQDSAATFRSIDTSSTVSHSSMNSDATLTIYTQSVNSQQLGVFLGNPQTMTGETSPPTTAPTTISELSCGSFECPTSCPAGYVGDYWQVSGIDCNFYCEDQPTYSQCAPGGSGCSSTCVLAPGIIAGIIVGSLVIVCGLLSVFIRWYFGRLFFCWPAKEPMATQAFVTNA